MYAVIETGGKQYRVSPETTVDVETLAGEIGGAVEFGRVVAIGNGEKLLTGDAVKSAKVTGTIESQARARRRSSFSSSSARSNTSGRKAIARTSRG